LAGWKTINMICPNSAISQESAQIFLGSLVRIVYAQRAHFAMSAKCPVNHPRCAHGCFSGAGVTINTPPRVFHPFTASSSVSASLCARPHLQRTLQNPPSSAPETLEPHHSEMGCSPQNGHGFNVLMALSPGLV
jgi:hypothetical protein